ncbi:MAG: YqeG family HAD IIIA-type phosphatase [Oscillospiraceae bacterium]|jgi:HAD superfamily phosphatase (TIGR01668 family)|nr:YqeG family HAD IIIA-type phosphatase [Oscillospiraceae bacterium]
MSFSIISNYKFNNLTDISPEFIKGLDISFLMIDLDNTIAAYDEHAPTVEILEWFEMIKSSGIIPFMISNTTRTTRVENFAKALNVEYIMRACKPSARSLIKAMEISNNKPSQSALIGDQVFTDVLAANRAKVVAILIKPKSFTNIFLRLRYYIEVPFRLLSEKTS